MKIYKLTINGKQVHQSNSLHSLNQFATRYLELNSLFNASVSIELKEIV